MSTLRHPDLESGGILLQIAERLKRDFGAERVLVYGSVARGEATADSDIDLLIIAPSAARGFERMAQARAAMRDLSFGLPLSPLVLTPAEVQQRLAGGDDFIREVLETGAEL